MKSLFLIPVLVIGFSTILFSQSVQEIEAKLKNAKSGELTKLYTDLGTAYYYDGDFTNALSYYFRALDVTKTVKDDRHIAVAYHGIGSVYIETEKLEYAVTYLKKAQRMFSEIKDQKSLGRVLLSLGNVYYMQEKDSLSEIYYRKALGISHSTNDSASLKNGYGNLGALYFEAGNRSDTLKGAEFIKKSLNYVKPGDTLDLFQIYLGLAELYSYSGNLSEAKPYLNHCARLLSSVKALHIIDDYYYCLHHYHKTRGDFKQALAAFQNYKIYQDSTINTENNKQLTELNVKYETGQKEKQIVLLNAQKETQQLILIIIILAVSIFVILAYFLFIRYKRRQLRKKERELQNQKETERVRIARDMHDEIGAGLTRIVMRSEQTKVQLQSGSDLKNDMMESLIKMTAEARELSHNIGEIIWALNPKNDTLDTLCSYIRNYAYDFLDEAGIGCQINFPDNIPGTFVAPELRRNIFLIVKESLNNIVKHSSASQVEITLTLTQKNFSIAIKDNGAGIVNSSRAETGNGLGNMKKRTEECGGKYTIRSEKGKGTEIIVEEISI